MIIGVTGHRKLLHSSEYVKEKFLTVLDSSPVTQIITGVALGFDQIVAECSIEKNIPFIAAVPFNGQENYWPKNQQEHYYGLLQAASEVIIVSPGSFELYKFQVRNEWVVDRCDLLIAYWNGSLKGGTANCLRYAKKIGRKVMFVK